MTEAPPSGADEAAVAEIQPESTGNTDTYVTSLSKEEEDRLLKASLETHIHSI